MIKDEGGDSREGGDNYRGDIYFRGRLFKWDDNDSRGPSIMIPGGDNKPSGC